MDGKFLNILKVAPYGDGINFCVLEPFSYMHSDGKVVTVPERFITDFASIPREFWTLVGAPWGKYGFIAAVHDWLYYNQETTKAYADDVLFEGMKIMGVGVLDRDAIYEAVSKAGESSWDENARKKSLGFLRVAPIFPTSVNDLPYVWAGTTGNWKKG